MRHPGFLLVCTLLATTVFSPATPAASTGRETGKRGNATKPAKPEEGLKRGMAAAEVTAIMGEPGERKPMKAPSGKAEVWRYTRTVAKSAEQVEVGTRENTAVRVDSDGITRTVVISTEPIFEMAYRTTEEEISLLMFNDHFVMAKVVVRHNQAFK